MVYQDVATPPAVPIVPESFSLCLHCQEWGDTQHVDAGDSGDLSGDYCVDCRETALCLLASSGEPLIGDREIYELLAAFSNDRGGKVSEPERAAIIDWSRMLATSLELVLMVLDGHLTIADVQNGEPVFRSLRSVT